MLAFVTGVPGSGKTLLGLQLVYQETKYSTWFLSGNNPLVEVLKYTLKSKSLVNQVYNIKKKSILIGT
ncbi:DNA/RNA helicase domain-containing protein [Acidaminococcus sp. LBK-2]|uniref:DNA/RNA helicase domain-containing protein n=1 Tax=Acidaminococcus sp. LBK-2 TaxID=3456956 RepID=UPI003FA472F4